MRPTGAALHALDPIGFIGPRPAPAEAASRVLIAWCARLASLFFTGETRVSISRIGGMHRGHATVKLASTSSHNVRRHAVAPCTSMSTYNKLCGLKRGRHNIPPSTASDDLNSY